MARRILGALAPMLLIPTVWGQEPFMPDQVTLLPEQQQQYRLLQQMYPASSLVRLFFFWTMGLMGYQKKDLPLGGHRQADFVREVDLLLRHVPTITIELMVDEPTAAYHQGLFQTLKDRHPHRFILVLVEDKLKELESQLTAAALQDQAPEVTRLKALIQALHNARKGNPALASDVARIWWLHHPLYTVNLYADIDTFVENAKKLGLAEIFPKKPDADQIIRMEIQEGSLSNDLLATYGLSAKRFDEVRKTFVDHQLVDPERQQLCRSYSDKWDDLYRGEEGFKHYIASVKTLAKMLKDDFDRQSQGQQSKFMPQGGKNGLSPSIAFLHTTGPAAFKGAQAFHYQLYKGEKPCSNSWGTFVWAPAKVMHRDERLQWLIWYLIDWNTFKRVGHTAFNTWLAKEILALHDSIKLADSSGVQKTGLEILKDRDIGADTHSAGIYDVLNAILASVKAFLTEQGSLP